MSESDKKLTKAQIKLRNKWCDALEGKLRKKYKQATYQLRSDDGSCHCCLGVLCDIVDPKGWDVRFEKRDQIPPYGISESAGIFGCGEFTAGALAEMNDKGKTFKQIAKAIRKDTKERS